jgi:hypothetical protein
MPGTEFKRQCCKIIKFITKQVFKWSVLLLRLGSFIKDTFWHKEYLKDIFWHKEYLEA